MAEIAIIGGTGMTSMEGLSITRREMVKTPYGSPSGPLIFGEFDGCSVAFLARHGHKHSIPPHRINYRANIWALNSVGIKKIIAVGAVGGIADECSTGTLVVPEQVIDYTHARSGTFFDGKPNEVKHVDFSFPYTESIRRALISAAGQTGVPVVEGGTYGVTQGPRLETAAEIRRMQQDGCTIVGMTSMPEAVLARELDIEYASCAVVVNRAAGFDGKTIDPDELSAAIPTGMESARVVVAAALARVLA